MRFVKLWQYIVSGLELIRDAYFGELKTIGKDKGALLIFFVAVVAYPVIYSIAYKNNVVREIPLTVVDLDKTAASQQVVKMLGATKELAVAQEAGSLYEARQLFREGNSKGVILIPGGFEKNLLRGIQTSVSVYCDAAYFLLYKETLNGSLQAIGTFAAGVEIKRLMAAGSREEQAMQQTDPVPVKFYNLYNPAGSYGSYVMPGIILVILQQTLLIGIGMIGGAGNERCFHFTIQHNGSRIGGMFSVVFGKGLAYFTIYLANIVFTLVYLTKWFGFPDKGSFSNVCILLVPYLFAVIFLGLIISRLFHRREHSIMTLVFISPVVLFISGLSWPESSIPPVLNYFGHILPSTTMIPAFLRIRSMGGSIQTVRPELFFLLIQMFVYFILAVITYAIANIRPNGLRPVKVLPLHNEDEKLSNG